MWAAALAACSLVSTASTAWLCRGSRPVAAVGLAIAVAAASMPVWASWTGTNVILRSAVLAAPAAVAAGLAWVATAWSPRGGWSLPAAAATGLALVAVAVEVLVYEPFADPWCSRSLPFREAPGLRRRLRDRRTGLRSPSSGWRPSGIGLAVVVTSRAAPIAVRVGVTVSLLAVGTGLVVELAWRDTDAWARTTSSSLAWAVAPAAGGMVLVVARAMRTRRAVDGLLHDLEEGRVEGVQFAVPGEERWVDAAGEEVPASPSGLVVLDDVDGPAVRIAAGHGTPEATGLTPARRLALSNARLTAVTAARLREVQAAQRRTVARADAERRRIERDLHDGAQQVLVSAAFHLSVAQARGGSSPGVTGAQSGVTAALDRLRDIVRGHEPAVLAEEGLAPALEELSAEASAETTVVVRGDREPAYDVALAAYHCGAALAAAAAPEPCRLEVVVTDDVLRLTAQSDADLSGALPVAVLDRIGAVGGTVRECQGGPGWAVEVNLPCA